MACGSRARALDTTPSPTSAATMTLRHIRPLPLAERYRPRSSVQPLLPSGKTISAGRIGAYWTLVHSPRCCAIARSGDYAALLGGSGLEQRRRAAFRHRSIRIRLARERRPPGLHHELGLLPPRRDAGHLPPLLHARAPHLPP